MSLPRPLHEQLLSAYLDDALTADERERVEQMLARDASTRDELQQMQRLQAETRRALAAAPDGTGQVKLDDQFPDRVLQAAFAEARRANLPSGHPLRRAADRTMVAKHPSRSRSAARIFSGRHRTAALLALAAVLLLAVTLGPWSADDGPAGGPTIAQQDTSAVDVQQPLDMLPLDVLGPTTAQAASEPETPERDAPNEVPAGATPEMRQALAVGDQSSQQPIEQPRQDAPAVDAPPVDAIASALIDRAPSQPMVARRDDDPSADIAPGDLLADAVDPTTITRPLNMVMVLQVQQTEQGRSSDAVLTALRQAGIRTGVRRMVDQQLVGYLRDAKMVAPAEDEGAEQATSILFVEASGKQLDRFIVSLFQQTAQIAGIGLDLGIDPPLLAAAGQLTQVDPGQVQHAADTATAWHLVRGEDQALFALPTEGRTFLPLNAQMAGAALMGSGSADSGPDITGRLLLLIR